MTAGQLERTIRDHIVKYLRTIPRSYWWVNHQGMYGQKGATDIMGVMEGRHVGIEVKRVGEQPTPLQLLHIRKIEQAGGVAGVARSVDDARAIVARAIPSEDRT